MNGKKTRVRVWFELGMWDRLRILCGSPVNHTLIVDCDTGNVVEQLVWIGSPDPKAIRRLPLGSGAR